MNCKLKELLEHLTEVSAPQRQLEIEELHRRTLNWEPVERLPLVMRYPIQQDARFQPYPHSQVFDDPEKMLYNELVHAFDTSIAYHNQIDDDLPYTIRPNFGTVIIGSMFGGIVERRQENPPWIKHFETLDEFKAAMQRDPLDFSQGWCPRVVERYRFYQEVFADFSELEKLIRVVLPDLQGPLDTVEMLRGSDVYVDFYTNPVLLSNAMEKVAEAQVGFAKHLAEYLTDGPDGFSHQHAMMESGNILIRDDSAVMISPQMYREQVALHDEYVLAQLGGGGVHACGKIEHNIPQIFDLPSIRCFDFGDSQMNDLDTIYPLASEKKIPLVYVSVSESELVSGQVLERFPTGVSLVHEAKSLEDAARIMREYKQATEGK